MSTVERAYVLARSGRYRDLAGLKARLEAEGCRAVDALLAGGSIRRHLQAICAAASRAPADAGASLQDADGRG